MDYARLLTEIDESTAIPMMMFIRGAGHWAVHVRQPGTLRWNVYRQPTLPEALVDALEAEALDIGGLI